MESVFGWVDFIQEDKEKMHEFIKAISDQDTRDELGIGSIRDAFSNLFFPGTSTIQTRVKYMLFVPWIYQIIEEEGLEGKEAAIRAREMEISLINTLKEAGEDQGLIGRDAGEKLQRTPAEIYWAGMKEWGILKFNGSRKDYHNYLTKYYYISSHKEFDDDNNPINDSLNQIWDPGLVEKPDDFPEKASFQLTFAEASYLYEKIKKNCSDTLLAELLDIELDDPDFIWDHKCFINLKDDLREKIRHAKYFAEVIQGANLLYNLMLAEEDENLYKDEKVIYRDKFNQWKRSIKMSIDEIEMWNLNEFWSICKSTGNIPVTTVDFINRWIDFIISEKHFSEMPDSKKVRALLYNRELNIKGKRARLQNPRYLQMWGGSSNINKLDYRWSIAKTHIRDIKEAINRGDLNDA